MSYDIRHLTLPLLMVSISLCGLSERQDSLAVLWPFLFFRYFPEKHLGLFIPRIFLYECL
jgi:hypothetical protein